MCSPYSAKGLVILDKSGPEAANIVNITLVLSVVAQKRCEWNGLCIYFGCPFGYGPEGIKDMFRRPPGGKEAMWLGYW